MKTIGILFVIVLAFACGGGGGGGASGVDGDKSITALEAGEVSSFCDWAIDTYGGEGVEHQCEDFTVTTPTRAECEEDYAAIPQSCEGVTVEEAEACVEAIASDPCNFGGQACAELLQCSLE